ncbi:MAG: bifunctional 5,10-methylenetetrahydrofolate dehydrogenase/5,10-methenyltetrahydrofolate cyclohydrolase [Hespellia sp.]|nr:bifunctional 5,10-methylenetetrahydrofolate dehydrogenase/5,10-methenyltetrahydrofolate cyclohydrolase [Hespellia sp.]
MATVLKGAEVTAALNANLKTEVEILKQRGIHPTLGIIRVGERPDDLSYEKGACKRAETIGVAVKKILLPEDASQEELLEVVERVNQDDQIHGVLLFRPLPKQMDDEIIRAALSPEKDIDGITDGSLMGVFADTQKGFPPCTAEACIQILNHFGIDPKGKKAVVLGRSLVIGKPVAMMLLKKNATVTICHTRTAEIPAECREADILIAAAGRAGVISSEFVKPGQVIIDVGINFVDGKLKGDVDFDVVEPIVEAVTPVPGGVGTVTTSVLIGHVIEAAKRTI